VVGRLVEIQIPAEVRARACAGDECAQAAIYAAVAPATFGLIRRLAGSRVLAEDLFQETLMAVFQRLGEFRGDAPLGAWVRQIAVSKWLMYLRSPWHRARLQLAGGFGGGGSGGGSLAAGAREDDDGDSGHGWRIEMMLPATPGPRAEDFDVERALASLTPTARAVVWLFEVEGYSHEEIAGLFGRSTSFSKSQLSRAHARLREWFEPRVDRSTCTTI